MYWYYWYCFKCNTQDNTNAASRACKPLNQTRSLNKRHTSHTKNQKRITASKILRRHNVQKKKSVVASPVASCMSPELNNRLSPKTKQNTCMCKKMFCTSGWRPQYTATALVQRSFISRGPEAPYGYVRVWGQRIGSPATCLSRWVFRVKKRLP